MGIVEMMTAERRDSLAEVINIGFSRAAAALSELTGHRVELQPPQVMIYPVGELGTALQHMADTDIATVHQVFHGPITGDALLVLTQKDAGLLARLLTDSDVQSAKLGVSERDVLTELGNVLLGSCLGTFGNMLQVRVSFTVPRLRLDSLSALLESLIVSALELRYGLVITTHFSVRAAAIAGNLIIVLGVSSLDRLLDEVAKLG